MTLNEMFLNMFGVSYDEYEKNRKKTKTEYILSLSKSEKIDYLNSLLLDYRKKYKQMNDLKLELKTIKFDIEFIMNLLNLKQHIYSNDDITILSYFSERKKLAGFNPDLFNYISMEGINYVLKVLEKHKIYEVQKPIIVIKEI